MDKAAHPRLFQSTLAALVLCWGLASLRAAADPIPSSLLEAGTWCLPSDLLKDDPDEPVGTPVTRDQDHFKLPVQFPGWSDLECEGPVNLQDAQAISMGIALPAEAPKDVQVVLYVKDNDHLWYQRLDQACLAPGESQTRIFSLSPAQPGWEPKGHVKAWDPYNLGSVQSFGIRLQSSQTFQGEAQIGPVDLIPKDDPGASGIQEFFASSSAVKCFDAFEISFSLSRVFENPFDPDQISILGEFRSPSGKIQTIPAFFYQPLSRHIRWGREKLAHLGGSAWRIRFCPTEPGIYTYVLRINDGQEAVTQPRQFEALPSDDRGFVRIDQDKKGFQFDDGSVFYPIGHVIRSAGDDRMAYDYEFEGLGLLGTYAYDEYFKKMQEQGINFCRIWMCSWWLSLEWNAKWPGYRGLGQYNLENAWRVDRLLSEANKRGIYVELTLTNHGQWSPYIDTEWENNPYNVDNGGFLRKQDDFFYDPEARSLSRRRHRYGVARWASQTHLMAWALCSEVEWVGPYFRSLDDPAKGDRAIVADWHREMAQFMRTVDPWSHVITSHFAFPNRGDEVWKLPEIEFVQCNGYTGYPILNATNAPQAFLNYYFGYVSQYGKPVMVGEYGGHWEKNTPDQLNVQLHTGCWGAFMSPMAGFGGYWWWPYIHAKDLYSHMGALVRFAAGEDRRGSAWEVIKPAVESEAGALVSQGLKTSNRAYLWVVHQQALLTWQGIPTLSGAKVAVEGLQEGSYEVEFWDTYEGKPIGKATVLTDQGKVLIELPPVDKDLALKLRHESLLGSAGRG